MTVWCSNCQCFKARRNGRCYGCDKWFRAMGYERPLDRCHAAALRQVHREMKMIPNACED